MRHARRRLPASRNSFDQKALGNPFASAQLRNAVLAAKAIQNDADFLLGRILLAGRSTCPSRSARTTIWRVRTSGSSALLEGYDEPEIYATSSWASQRF